ncbi:MAG: hypothetical protein KAQ98_09795, partial [Bacteriovoracaceae bacterium]|nr:hypothetical protein [Bacteriovoracaceae bacterium]
TIGDTIKLYTSSDCTGFKGSTVVDTVTEYITSDVLTVDATYTFYVNSTDPVGNISDCSVAGATYVFDTTAPATPSLTLYQPVTETGTDSTPTFEVYDVTIGDTIKLYTSSDCTGFKGSTVVDTVTEYITSDVLTVDATYTFYVNSTDPVGNISECSVVGATYVLDTTAPATPSLTLYEPVTETGTDSTPTFEVSDVTIGDTIKLYTSSDCTGFKGSTVVDTVTEYITSDVLTVDATYTFYVNSTDPLGNISDCSVVGATYVFDTTAPATPSLTLFEPVTETGTDSTPTFEVSDVTIGDTIKLYTSSDCTGFKGSTVVDTVTEYITSNVLTVDATYTFYVNSTDPVGNISDCSIVGATYVFDTTAPATPSLTLHEPVTETGTDSTPTFEVTGITIGDTIGLYSDSNCSVSKGATIVDTATEYITSDVLTVDATYTFYVNSTDPVGNISDCSVAGAMYVLDITPPSAPSGLSLIDPATTPRNDPTPEIQVNGVISGDTIGLYSDSGCVTSVGTGVSTGTTISITTSELENGSYKFYADSTDPVGNTSVCSTASVSYRVILGDLDDDQDVDADDYTVFMSSFGYSVGATEYLVSADYNKDDTVDETDRASWLWFEYLWQGYHRGSDLHYKFENDSGVTITDSSTNSNDGTTSGAPTHVTGKVDLLALSLDGSVDYVDCGSGVFINTNNQITFEAWLKSSSTSDQYVLKKDTVSFDQAISISQLVDDLGWNPAFGITRKRAQTFTLSSAQKLLKVRLKLKELAGATGDILVKIYNDDNGGSVPGSVLHDTKTIPNGTTTTSYAWYDVTFDLSLSAGTYWLVLESPTTSGAWNYEWAGTGTNYYRDGVAWYFNATSWVNDISDQTFEIQTEAVVTSKISMPDPGFKFLIFNGTLGTEAIVWEDSGLELVVVSDDASPSIQNISAAGVDVYINYDLGTSYSATENKSSWEDSMETYIDNHSYVDGFFWGGLDKITFGATNVDDFNTRFASINSYVGGKGQKVIAHGVRYYANNGGSDYYMWNNCLTNSSYTYLDFYDRTGMGDDSTVLINGIKKWEYLDDNSVLNKTLCLSYGDEDDDTKSIYNYIGSRVLDLEGFGYVNFNSFATASITLADGMKWNLGDRISRTIDEIGDKLTGRFVNGEVENDITVATTSGTPVYTSDLISDVFNSNIVDDFTIIEGLSITLNRGQVELLNGVLRSSTVLTSDFHHVVVTLDKTADQAAVFVDGVLSGERALPDITFSTTANLFMGVDFNGVMDEYKLYNRILTDEEILHHYNQEQ